MDTFSHTIFSLQALAKMRLSETVTAGDVLEATRLMKVATQTAATDPRTGTYVTGYIIIVGYI